MSSSESNTAAVPLNVSPCAPALHFSAPHHLPSRSRARSVTRTQTDSRFDVHIDSGSNTAAMGDRQLADLGWAARVGFGIRQVDLLAGDLGDRAFRGDVAVQDLQVP
eukprot:433695-Rhodomonas_salina.4